MLKAWLNRCFGLERPSLANLTPPSQPSTPARPAAPLKEVKPLDESPAQKLYNHFVRTYMPTIVDGLRASLDRPTLGRGSDNALTAKGAKIYSQNDEDGITFEILRRLGKTSGVFAEFGVGDGRENNTLALVAARWSGFWVGGEDLAFNTNPTASPTPRFSFEKAWVKRSNIVELYQRGLTSIGQTHCDVISLDFDGNDFHFVETLLAAGAAPDLFIVEYNGKFLPPIEFVIAYDDAHAWQGDDYFGASLASFARLFERYGYFLACCNETGINAFFVRREHEALFSDTPRHIDALYTSPKYFLDGLHSSGHPISLRTLQHHFAALNA